MKLTKEATELKFALQNEKELTEEQLDLFGKIGLEPILDLLQEGNIKPEDWIACEDLKRLQDAIKVVGEFVTIIDELVEG